MKINDVYDILPHSLEQDLYVNSPFFPNKILPLGLNDLKYFPDSNGFISSTNGVFNSCEAKINACPPT